MITAVWLHLNGQLVNIIRRTGVTILFQSTCILLCLCFNSNVPQFVAQSANQQLILRNTAYPEYIWFHAEHKHPPARFPPFVRHHPGLLWTCVPPKILAEKLAVLLPSARGPPLCTHCWFSAVDRGRDTRQGRRAASRLDYAHVEKPSGWPARMPDVEVRARRSYWCGLFGYFAKFPQKQHWKWSSIKKKWTLGFLAGKCYHKTRLERDFDFKSPQKKSWGKKLLRDHIKHSIGPVKSCDIYIKSPLAQRAALWWVVIYVGRADITLVVTCLFPHWRKKTLLLALQATRSPPPFFHIIGEMFSCAAGLPSVWLVLHLALQL